MLGSQMPINDLESLRPMERRVLTMREEGISIEEIADRMRKSPAFIERVIDWTKIPRSGTGRSTQLSPLESRVLALKAEGEDHETIGKRFKKSERFIRQVEGLAHYRKGLRLMSGAAKEARRAEQTRP